MEHYLKEKKIRDVNLTRGELNKTRDQASSKVDLIDFLF